MTWLSDLKRGLQRFGEQEKPRAERRAAPGLAARYGIKYATDSAGIKDISSSGIYLFTEKRLRTGELATLELREEGEPEQSEDLQISVHARVAREGEDGIGLSFLLPPGMNTDLWGVLVRNIVLLTDHQQVAEMFLTLRTILFLCRICQAEAEEAIHLLGGQLDAERTANVVRIAIAAEHQLNTDPEFDSMRADPKLVANLLRDGSWAPDDLTLQLWTGLLVSSCSTDASDDANRVLAELLVQFTATQAKIFILACERTLASAQASGKPASGPVVLTPKEMVELTGVHDLFRNATDLAYLFNLGLIEKVFDFTSYHDAEQFDISPTLLGLELYKHCHGSREKLAPELVESARTHLANFLPAPQPTDVYSPTPFYSPPDS
jgi:PilZ domain-containing protein